jgi:hypothetical protein
MLGCRSERFATEDSSGFRPPDARTSHSPAQTLHRHAQGPARTSIHTQERTRRLQRGLDRPTPRPQITSLSPRSPSTDTERDARIHALPATLRNAVPRCPPSRVHQQARTARRETHSTAAREAEMRSTAHIPRHRRGEQKQLVGADVRGVLRIRSAANTLARDGESISTCQSRAATSSGQATAAQDAVSRPDRGSGRGTGMAWKVAVSWSRLPPSTAAPSSARSESAPQAAGACEGTPSAAPPARIPSAC